MTRYFSYVNWHEFLFRLWGGWRPPMWPLVSDPRMDEYGCTMQMSEDRQARDTAALGNKSD